MSGKVKFHGSAFDGLETTERLSDAQIDTHARVLLEQLSLDEKIKMMSGDPPFWTGMTDMTGGRICGSPLGGRSGQAAGDPWGALRGWSARSDNGRCNHVPRFHGPRGDL